MSIKSVNNISARQYQVQFKEGRKKSDPSMTKENGHHKSNAPLRVKIGALVGTLTGVGLVMAQTLKKKGYNISLKSIIKTPIKDWGLFSVKYSEENHEIPKLVGLLGLGSVFGGLLGGAAFDKKENLKAKIREGIIQLIGNIGTPLVCVLGIMKLFKKYEPQILERMPKTKIGQGLPGVLATIGALIPSIILGNKVGNFINEKLFHVKDNRKLKLSDMSPHIDDLCVAISIAGADNPMIPRIIPAALSIAGFATGTAQERPERLHHKIVEQH